MKKNIKDFTVINASIMFVTHDNVFNKVNHRFEIIKVENGVMYIKKEKFTIFGVNFETINKPINIWDVERCYAFGGSVCSGSSIEVEIISDVMFTECRISFGEIINRFDIVQTTYNDIYFHDDNLKKRLLKIFGSEVCWDSCNDYKTKYFRDTLVKDDRRRFRFNTDDTLGYVYYNSKYNLAGDRHSFPLSKELYNMKLNDVRNISLTEFERLLNIKCSKRHCRYIWMLLHDEVGLLFDDVYEYLKYGNKLSQD